MWTDLAGQSFLDFPCTPDPALFTPYPAAYPGFVAKTSMPAKTSVDGSQSSAAAALPKDNGYGGYSQRVGERPVTDPELPDFQRRIPDEA